MLIWLQESRNLVTPEVDSTVTIHKKIVAVDYLKTHCTGTPLSVLKYNQKPGLHDFHVWGLFCHQKINTITPAAVIIQSLPKAPAPRVVQKTDAL